MGYTRRNFLKRIRQYANRILLSPTGTPNEYDVSQVEGSVSQIGVAYSDVNMNEIDFNLYLLANTFLNTSGTDAFAITIPGVTSYTQLEGIPLKFKTSVVNTAACSLNINGLGVKNITKDVSVPLETGDILVNSIVVVVYDGTQFQISKLNNLASKTYVLAQTWHAGNDGANSGLDADIVRGINIFALAYDHLASLNLARMLTWKNYGNGHVIFDASQSTAPNGVAVNNKDSAGPWTPTYPTLMGWNGSSTFGVRVDSARIADAVVGGTPSTSVVISSGWGGTSYASGNMVLSKSNKGEVVTLDINLVFNAGGTGFTYQLPAGYVPIGKAVGVASNRYGTTYKLELPATGLVAFGPFGDWDTVVGQVTFIAKP